MPSITPQPPLKNHPDGVPGLPDLQTVQRSAREASHQVTAELKKFSTLAQANPAVSAAVILGAGVLLGAVVTRLVARPPSLGTLLMKALRDGASSTGHTFASGLASAQRMMK